MTTRRPRLVSLLASTLLLGTLASTSALAQGRCTTRTNPLTGNIETRCNDGTSATSRQSPLTGNTETTIQYPTPRAPSGQWVQPAPVQRCTSRYNALTRQVETQCY